MTQLNKNERAYAPKDVQHFCKEFIFANDIFKRIID